MYVALLDASFIPYESSFSDTKPWLAYSGLM
jgi:hypothetical protein